MSELGKVVGKTFLITGGASGLGAGYVQAFLENGAKAVAILDISEEAGKALTEKLNNVYPGQVIFWKCDVSSEESLTRVFNEVVNQFTTVDVIINNAGVMNDSPNMWRKSCDINYQGVVSLTFKGLKHMRKDEGGSGGTIINISSTAALYNVPYVPTYSGCKAAVLHFSSCIAMDPFHERTGVRILTICVGPTDTPIFSNLDKLSYDEPCGKEMNQRIDRNALQKPESAVKGLVEAFKQGVNGSVWLATKNKPVKDITPVLNEAIDFVKSTLEI
ncbi:hypothetical protein ABMA27_004812 [Loxostege sticticalis]|uniref:15-hydroxyprostaglandin dehydrogenase [NAD(+)] n=1 Tax=Loxostege sticticalis TaxID=481309 RepID=A0ABR3HKR1_LOXSC